MKHLFLLLVLTACTAPNTSAGTAATNAAQTDLRPLPEKDYKLFINNGNPYLREYQEFFAGQLKRYGTNTKGEPLVNFTELQAFASFNSFLGIYSFMEETFKPNITNIALTKYEAREALTEEEYLALRKPVPNWETYKRLIRAEDGFDNLSRFYLATNIIAPNLDWNSIVYYDPKNESYYHGVFKPTNINGWQDLINTKKDPAREIYGRDRVVLITNISPSLHIYADAYNDYKFYALELKSTIDDYGFLDSGMALVPFYLPLEEQDTNITITWQTFTNRTMGYPISYYALTNGKPILPPIMTEYIKREEYIIDLTNKNKLPFDVYPGITISYSEETKEVYYGLKYNFYGDIAELTNEKPPMKTNYIRFYYDKGKKNSVIGSDSAESIRYRDGAFMIPLLPD